MPAIASTKPRRARRPAGWFRRTGANALGCGVTVGLLILTLGPQWFESKEPLMVVASIGGGLLVAWLCKRPA